MKQEEKQLTEGIGLMAIAIIFGFVSAYCFGKEYNMVGSLTMLIGFLLFACGATLTVTDFE